MQKNEILINKKRTLYTVYNTAILYVLIIIIVKKVNLKFMTLLTLRITETRPVQQFVSVFYAPFVASSVCVVKRLNVMDVAYKLQVSLNLFFTRNRENFCFAVINVSKHVHK